MIVGLGFDLVDIGRIDAMLARFGARAVARLFTDDEHAWCVRQAKPAASYAARFAAKEAAYKALSGSDDARAIGWRDVEVVRGPDGAPSLRLHGAAAARAAALGASRLHVSLTHADGVAGAVVVVERD